MNTFIPQTVTDEVARWPGVMVESDHLAGVEFRLGYRELGHIHGTDVGHVPVPPDVRDRLISAGRASPHPMFPTANWVEIVISTPEAAEELLRLFRMNYDRFGSRAGNRAS